MTWRASEAQNRPFEYVSKCALMRPLFITNVSLSDVVSLSEIGLEKQKTYKEMLSILQYIFSKSNLCWASDAKPIHSFKN